MTAGPHRSIREDTFDSRGNLWILDPEDSSSASVNVLPTPQTEKSDIPE